MFNRIIKYVVYLFKSRVWGHGIHSPFAYDLITEVIDSETKFRVFEQIEIVRQNLLLDKTKVLIKDYGAGSKKKGANSRSIHSIAKKSLKQPKYGQLLYRLIDHFGFKNILELGTSFGITTSYMASPNKDIQVATIEGDSIISKKAQSNFDALDLSNITLKNAQFNDVLQPTLNELKSVDLVFIDGHHTHEATINYFNKCLAYKQNNSLFVIDDINWSAGMRQAWNEIKEHSEVTLTIDLFELGLVFFRKESSKENIVVYY